MSIISLSYLFMFYVVARLRYWIRCNKRSWPNYTCPPIVSSMWSYTLFLDVAISTKEGPPQVGRLESEMSPDHSFLSWHSLSCWASLVTKFWLHTPGIFLFPLSKWLRRTKLNAYESGLYFSNSHNIIANAKYFFFFLSLSNCNICHYKILNNNYYWKHGMKLIYWVELRLILHTPDFLLSQRQPHFEGIALNQYSVWTVPLLTLVTQSPVYSSGTQQGVLNFLFLSAESGTLDKLAISRNSRP